jgi:hypothetical protein
MFLAKGDAAMKGLTYRSEMRRLYCELAKHTVHKDIILSYVLGDAIHYNVASESLCQRDYGRSFQIERSTEYIAFFLSPAFSIDKTISFSVSSSS